MIPPQQGAQPQTAEQMGAVPQSQAQQGQQKMTPEALDYLRNGDQELRQAIGMFMGREIKPEEMKNVPDQMLIQIAGMVQKLGVNGAVAMAQKMIPPDVQQKLKAAV